MPQFRKRARLEHADVRVGAAARGLGPVQEDRHRRQPRAVRRRGVRRSVRTSAGAALVTATVFFAFQIYCDFSGYTDTARGVARMLGFELIRNFDYPYLSKTPVEFWQRWHISLSQWFQDYLYYPLAMRYMRRGGWASKYKAHIVAMALIGFWHGANWTFLVFGLYWGMRDRAVSRDGRNGGERTARRLLPIDFAVPRRTLRDFGSVAADVRGRLHRLGVLPRRVDR